MNKKLVGLCFAVILAIAFILVPLPASDLIIRVYFDNIADGTYALYYTTDSQDTFSEDRCIVSEIDSAQNRVEFRLDGSLEGHLTNLRLDFPQAEQLICVRNITASSSGIIRRSYNPCSFFADENIAFSHETSVSPVYSRRIAYLSTGSNDPYIGLSASLIGQLQNCYGHRTRSRLLLCLMIAGSCLLARKKLFS